MLTWTWIFILEMPCSLALLVLVTSIIVRLGGGGVPSKPLENVNRLPRIGETLERNSVD